MEGKTKANAAKGKENKDRSSKMVIVKNLIEKGKKNGTLTYKEIMDELDSHFGFDTDNESDIDDDMWIDDYMEIDKKNFFK